MAGPLLEDGINVGGTSAAVQAPGLADGNIDEVKARVEADPASAKSVLAAERDGDNRVTLVEWLEGQVPFDPADHNIDEVKAHVEENPDEVADILEAEKAGENRVTLVEWLEGRESDEDILG
jgi:hypothetical protein